MTQTAIQTHEFETGDRVTGVYDDTDIGTVTEIDGDQITVAWDSHVTTTQSASVLVFA